MLLEAFEKVRDRRPAATLTIVGCSPDVAQHGVRVLGFLDKDKPGEAALLRDALLDSTLFAMPSQWESLGIVYAEAAMFGLPVVMLAGQGREDMFPASMASVLQNATAQSLAHELLALAEDPERMPAMGAAGRQLVLERHTWPQTAAALTRAIEQVVDRLA